MDGGILKGDKRKTEQVTSIGYTPAEVALIQSLFPKVHCLHLEALTATASN